MGSLLSSKAVFVPCDRRLQRAYWPRSIYQYSNMAPRLSGQTSMFGDVFFASKSLSGIERQRKL